LGREASTVTKCDPGHGAEVAVDPDHGINGWYPIDSSAWLFVEAAQKVGEISEPWSRDWLGR